MNNSSRAARGRSPPTHAMGAKAGFARRLRRGSWRRRESRRTSEDLATKLAEAYARGREEGLAEGRVEGSDRHATELAAARDLAETQQQELHLEQSVELEAVIRSGIKEIENNVGGAVVRILAPFLSQHARPARRGRVGHRRLAGSPLAIRPGCSKFVDPNACLRSCARESSIFRSRLNMSRMTGWRPSSRRIRPALSPSFALGSSCLPRSRPERGQ